MKFRNNLKQERSAELKLRLISIEREATQRKLKSIRNYADELEEELTGPVGAINSQNVLMRGTLDQMVVTCREARLDGITDNQ